MKSETNFLQMQNDPTFERLFAAMCSHRGNTAFVYEQDGITQSVTYAGLQARAERAAVRLQVELGTANRGRFVGLHLDNCLQWPILFWGLLMAGYRPLLLDARVSGDALHDLLSRAQAAALLTAQGDEPAGGVRQLSAAQIVSGDEYPHLQPQWEDHVALCTSGTGGAAKLVVYRGSSVVSNVLGAREAMRESPYLMRPHTVKLAFAPFHHVMGLLTLSLYNAMGKTIVLLPDRTPATIKRVCVEHGVNLIYGVPLMWNAMAAKIRTEVARKPLPARIVFRTMCGLSWMAQTLMPHWGQQFAQKGLFRSFHKKAMGIDICLVSGAAPLPRQTLRTLTAMGFPLLSGYGMTEACVISCDVGRGLRPRLHGSVGRAFARSEVRVAPETERGAAGEIQVRGESLYSYDLRNGQLVPPERPGGWMATGDVGRVVDGHIYIVGRSKDTIVPATGENVYPEQVEEAFAGLPGVENFSVLGLAGNNGTEMVGLIVYPADGRQDGGHLAQIARQVAGMNERLAMHKRVTRLLVSDAPLPATTTMKIKRQVLKKALESGQWQYRELSLSTLLAEPVAVSVATANTIENAAGVRDKVRALVSDALQVGPETVKDESHLVYDLGGDSLKLLELLMRVEQTFDLFDEREALRACLSVRELSAMVEDLLAGGHPLKTAQQPSVRHPILRIEDDPRFVEMAQRLAAAGDVNPYFIAHDSTVRDTSKVAGIELINFASYNYLGLSGHPRVVAAAQAAAEELGTSASGSRLLTGEKSLYRQLEREIAEWKQAEDALVLVSGHATNVSFVGNFCGEADLILYDSLSHNSIEQGCRLSQAESRAFPHNDVHGLEQILKAVRHKYEKVLIVVEGVYSMDGDVAPIREFVALKHRYGAFLMVDEAHSAGVLGECGKGVDEYFGLAADDIDIRMGTLSKALGSCGGYLAGRADLINYLRYVLPGFVFSVGISPPNAAAALEALRTLRAEPQLVRRLHENIECFIREARQRGFDTCGAAVSPVTPILVGAEDDAFRLCAQLRERGVFVAPAVFPAVPKGQARLRFCVTSDHQPEQITHALDALVGAMEEIGCLRSSQKPAGRIQEAQAAAAA